MKQFTPTLLALMAFLLFGSSLFPQDADDRMIVHAKDGQKHGFRLNDVDSIKFAYSGLDLETSITGTPDAAVAGKVSINITAGTDVATMKLMFLESFMVPDDVDDRKLLEISKMLNDVISVTKPGKWDLNGLQHGYKYKAFLLPSDSTGIYGAFSRTSFALPRLPLQGNPKVDVQFSKITYATLTAKVTPNSDVQGYFFFLDTKDPTEREKIMKAFGIPDLQHYIVKFGGKMGKPYTAPSSIEYKDLSPNTEYQIFAVLIDAKGQYSEVQTFDVVTKKKGTSETSKIALTVKDVTATSATVSAVPNEATQWYRYLIVEQSAYNEEEMKKFLIEEPASPQFPKDLDSASFTWSNLTPNTAYFAVAVGINGDNKPGEMTKVPFTTLKAASSSARSKDILPRREAVSKEEANTDLSKLPTTIRATHTSANGGITVVPAE